jgi:phosphoribosylglycinamide formyltransferase-1
MIKKISIFASGNGLNTFNLIKYFKNNKNVEVSCVITNNPNSGVILISKDNNIPVYIIDNKNVELTLDILKNYKIDLIVLAGYLKKVSKELIDKYKIINIHPSLLPKYGGRGMYGINVHKAVIDNKEIESGLTIHYVNNYYDEGLIIHQSKCNIEFNETPQSLSDKIRQLEHESLPKIIEQILF